MTSFLQQFGTQTGATQKVRLADHRADLNVSISLLLALLIIPTPSGVLLIA